MGWKRVRDHLGVLGISKSLRVIGDASVIEIVRVVHQPAGLMVTRLMTISVDNASPQLVSVLGSESIVENLMTGNRMKELHAVYRLVKEEMATVQALMKAPDEFHQSVPLYRMSEEGVVICDFCETAELGEVTHAGRLIGEDELCTSVVSAMAARLNQFGARVARELESVQGQLVRLTAEASRLPNMLFSLKSHSDCSDTQAAQDLTSVASCIAEELAVILQKIERTAMVATPEASQRLELAKRFFELRANFGDDARRSAGEGAA